MVNFLAAVSCFFRPSPAFLQRAAARPGFKIFLTAAFTLVLDLEQLELDLRLDEEDLDLRSPGEEERDPDELD